MEKIQMLISSKNTIKVLNKKETNIKPESDAIRDKNNTLYTNKEIRYIKNNYNFKKENITANDNAPEINNLIENYSKTYEKINDVINNELEDQNKDLKEKLRQRKERSINKSLNKSGNLGSNNTKKNKNVEDNNIDLKNILKDLNSENIENPFLNSN